MVPGGDRLLGAAIGAVDRWRGADIAVTPVSLGADDRHFLVEAARDLFMLRLTAPLVEGPRADPGVELAVSRAAAATGAGPEVVATIAHLGCLVTTFVPGRPITVADLARDDTLAATIGTIRALHACPPPSTPRSLFREASELRRLAMARGASMPAAGDDAADVVGCIEEVVEAHPLEPVACHGDLTPASVLVEGDAVRLVDFRWTGAGDRFDDLGTLCAALSLPEATSDAVLVRYFGTLRDDHRARLALMRIAADYRAAMRALARSSDGAAAAAHLALERVASAGRDERFDRWLALVAAARR